jgi:hypothetical protein
MGNANIIVAMVARAAITAVAASSFVLNLKFAPMFSPTLL